MSIKAILRNRAGSGLSIANSLTFVITLTIVCFLHSYIVSERSFDRQLNGHEQVYRISKSFVNEAGESVPDAFTPSALAPALKSTYPQIEHATRIHIQPEAIYVKLEKDKFKVEQLFEADSNFFNVFNFKFEEGSASSFQLDPNSVIIDSDLSETLFGKQTAIGRELVFDNEGTPVTRTVAGVITRRPFNSHFHPKMIIRLKAPAWMNESLDAIWDGYDWYTYVKFAPNTDVTHFKEELNALTKGKDARLTASYDMMALADIHLNSHLNAEIEENGSAEFLQFLMFIKWLILICGVINFINYWVVKVINDSKPLAMKEVLGASRLKVISEQMTITAITIAFVAGVTALIFVALGGFIYEYLKITLTEFFSQIWLFAVVALISTAVAIFFSVMLLLKRATFTEVLGGGRGIQTRTSLQASMVIFQFFIACTLVSCIAVIYRQTVYLRDLSPGFKKEAVVVLQGIGEHGDVLKQNLLESGLVTQVSYATSSPGDVYPYFAGSLKDSDIRVISDYAYVDPDYFQLMGIETIAGRSFTASSGEDANSMNIVINKTAQRKLGVTGIGDKITPNPKSPQPMYFTVVGIVEDFHASSFHNTIRPMFFLYAPTGPKMILKLTPGSLADTVGKLEKQWKAVEDQQPFDFYFIEDRVAGFYQKEIMFSRAFWILSITCLLIATAGVVIVSNIWARERSREMCIRKIIGAPASNIFFLFTRKVVSIILLAVAASVPAAFYLLPLWLETFAYRIDISPWDFILSDGLVILISVCFVTPLALRLAIRMPIAQLRS